jgi:hydroxymethylglutaryl-CoA synthase
MVGIVGYGCAFAHRTFSTDHDYVTLAVAAARRALEQAPQVNPQRVGALYVGAPSPAIENLPRARIVARALGLPPQCHAADVQAGLRSGSTAFFTTANLVKPSTVDFGIAIASDSPHPTSPAPVTGAAAFVLSRDPAAIIALLEAEGGGKVGVRHLPAPHVDPRTDPAVIATVRRSRELLRRKRLTPADVSHAVLPTSANASIDTVAEQLGLTKPQLRAGRLPSLLDAAQSTAPLLSLAAILDEATPGQRVLLTVSDPDSDADAYLLAITTNHAHRTAHPTVRDLLRTAENQHA